MFLQHYIGENERHIKESWFVSSIIYPVYFFAANALVSYVFLQQQSFAYQLSMCLGFSLVAVPILLLLFHFSYRKSGTRFLTLLMLLRLVGTIIGGDVNAMILNMNSIHSDLHQSFGVFIFCSTCATIGLFLELGWLLLSYRLRKLNLKGVRAMDFRLPPKESSNDLGVSLQPEKTGALCEIN